MRTTHTIASVTLTLAGLAAQAPTTSFSQDPVLGSAHLVAGKYARMDALVDANLDGKMDAVGFFTTVKYSTRGDLRVMFNDGKGNMSERILLANVGMGSNIPKADIVLGDWDGDGNTDFALDHFDGQYSYYLSRKTGPSFVTTAKFKPNGSITSSIAADFNGDKKDDMAVLTTTGMYLFLNVGGVPALLGHARAGGGAQLQLMDVDKDGLSDLMYVENTNTVHLLKVHRKSPWTGPRSDAVTEVGKFVIGDLFKFHAACGDYDRDGDEDVVMFSPLGQYRVVQQTSKGKFSVTKPVYGGPATRLFDIDRDGDLDGICCGGGGGSYPGAPNTGQSIFEVAINDKGQFRPAVSALNIGARHIAGAADMNGDGRIDLVAGRGILFNKHGFDHGFTLRAAAPTRPRLLPTQTVDDDGDGDTDVHTRLYSEVYRGRGDGSVTLHMPKLPKPPTGYSFHADVNYRGDWDGDGDQDLLVAAYQTVNNIKGMHLLRNVDGLHYVDAGPITPAGDSFHTQYKTWAAQSAYFAVDLNKDGLTDLITHLGAAAGSRAFVNQGNRKFVEVSHGLKATIDYVKDFDGDGYPEVVAKGASGTIDVYKGTPDGTLGAKTQLISGLFAGSYSVVDYDRDRDFDIYAKVGTDVVLLVNQGAGKFDRHTLVGPVDKIAKMWVRDLDRDGREDLFIYPASQTGAAYIVTQPAPGKFAFREQAVADSDFELADMDGDGDVDVVGTFLLRNITFHGPSAGSTVQYGVSTAGSKGVAPQLGATGPFRPGETSSLLLRTGSSNSLAMIIAGASSSNLIDFPWPGVNTYVFPQPVQAIVPTGGTGNWSLSVRLDSGIANATIYYQAYVLDTFAPSGIVSTNGVRVRYGN